MFVDVKHRRRDRLTGGQCAGLKTKLPYLFGAIGGFPLKPRTDLALEIADGELIVLDKAAGRVHQFNVTATLVHGTACSRAFPSTKLHTDCLALLTSTSSTALADVRAVGAEFERLELLVE